MSGEILGFPDLGDHARFRRCSCGTAALGGVVLGFPITRSPHVPPLPGHPRLACIWNISTQFGVALSHARVAPPPPAVAAVWPFWPITKGQEPKTYFLF